MKTKTPRTDKQVFPKGAYGQSAVSADFARQLERELALAVNALKNIIDHGADGIDCRDMAKAALAEIEGGQQ